jgi:hypothetical protein
MSSLSSFWLNDPGAWVKNGTDWTGESGNLFPRGGKMRLSRLLPGQNALTKNASVG